MLPRLATVAAALAVLAASALAAQAGVLVTVNKTTQRLTVSVDGEERYVFPVSTARWGYHTPNGTYRPQRLERQWYSRKYDNSPMPYSIFFAGGYAIHGSYEISHIGRPASHGCIRLHPRNAAVLFRLVRANEGDTRIVVTGERQTRSAYSTHSTRTKRAERAERIKRAERIQRAERAERIKRTARAEQPSRRYRAHYGPPSDDDFEGVFNEGPPPGVVTYGDDGPEQDYAVRHWWRR